MVINMKKTFFILFTIAFLAIIFFFPIATKLSVPEEYSFFENRNLEPAPELNRDNLLSGKYFSDFEKYYVDHIALRDEMIAAYTYFNVNFTDKVVVNDIVITDTALLPYNPQKVLDRQQIKDSAETMAAKLETLNDHVIANGGKFVYVGVPEQSSMFRDLYPSYMNNNSDYLNAVEESFFDALDAHGVDYINMMDIYLKADDFSKYYSVTDHHYNMLGAYECYKSIMAKCEELGIGAEILTDDDLIYEELPNPYYGSRGRILYKMFDTPDKLGIYNLKEPIEQFNRWDNGVNINKIFFIPDDPDEKITYNVYMGGDNAETVIETYREHLPNILAFGDSFTNPVETLLYASFNKTVTLDLRHYTAKSLYEYIEEFKPDFVICLRDDTAYLSFEGNGSF